MIKLLHRYWSLLLLFAILAGCADNVAQRPSLDPATSIPEQTPQPDSNVTAQPAPERSRQKPEFTQELNVTDPQEAKSKKIALLILPEGDAANDARAALQRQEMQNGALLAMRDTQTPNPEIITGSNSQPFAGLQYYYDDTSNSVVQLDQQQLVAIIGPLGSQAAQFMLTEKDEDLLSFTFTNKSELGSGNNFIIGLTPEQQAKFLAHNISVRTAPHQPLELTTLLEQAGLGYFPPLTAENIPLEAENSTADTTGADISLASISGDPQAAEQPTAQAPLPVLIIGEDGDSFFDRFYASLKSEFSRIENEIIGKPEIVTAGILPGSGQASLTIPDDVILTPLTPLTPPVVAVKLGKDRKLWSKDIEEILHYQTRQSVFLDRIASIENREMQKILEENEILEPSQYSSVILLMHRAADIQWLASLIQYYDNAWQPLPVYGLENWNQFGEIRAETSLQGSFFPARVVNPGIESKLEQEYRTLYQSPPSSIAKQVYDITRLIFTLSETGLLTPTDSSRQQLIEGWGAQYVFDPQGYIYPNLALVTLENNQLRSHQPDLTPVSYARQLQQAAVASKLQTE